MGRRRGGKLVKTFEGLKEDAEALAFSKDGKRFLANDGKTVCVFDVDSGKIIHRFEEHTDQVLAVAFLPDGQKALSAGKDNTLRLWSCRSDVSGERRCVSPPVRTTNNTNHTNEGESRLKTEGRRRRLFCLHSC